MTRSRLWRELESGDTGALKALRFCILAGGGLFLCLAAALFLPWQSQVVLGGMTLAGAIVLDRCSKSHVVTLTLVLLSAFSTVRYGVWRFSSTIAYFRDPGSQWSGLDAFFIGMLLAAECYAFVVLLLGYLQTLWPLRRSPVPLPNDPEEWPAVDLLIPTYNEPLSVVRFTALAAMNIDWPAEKLNVYILDDGRREEFRAFAEEAGVGYMARDGNKHAKAGNLNYALERLSAPFVAVFDCDHVPTRSFLQLTMGWFLRDAKLAMLQTPQHSYSPDPFERNLGQFHVTPNEDELFYGVVQDGNDFWNATSFCGSCAVLRRRAVDEAGGVAVETVTEDAHTSLRMQMRGWNTAYINIPQAAGLANERLSAHIRQRIRWARGMVQILRIENPLFARGLRPAQRLCYFNAMSHFLYALPRLIFLTAPVIYLIFGIRTLPGYWLAIVAYAVPYLALAAMTNSRIQGEYRHSFWNEIYETVLAPYLLLPTLIALVRPRIGRFNVTPKGGVVHKGYFDARIARPFLLLAAFNAVGLLCALARFVRVPELAGGSGLDFLNLPASLYDGGHAGTILVNVLWALFNLMILGVATAVAWESQQRRRSVRVALAVPADVILPDGSMIQGMTCDLSSGGVRTTMNQGMQAKVGEPIQFVFPVLDGSATLPATIISIDGSDVRAQFKALSLQEDESLTMILYSRADAWLDVEGARELDRPMRSMGRILRLSARGLTQALVGRRGLSRETKRRLAASVVPMLLLGLALAFPREVSGAGQVGAKPAAAGQTAAGSGEFEDTFSLADGGAVQGIDLHGAGASSSVSFVIPMDRMVKTAEMKLRYRVPAGAPAEGKLNVSLNGTWVTAVALGGAGQRAEDGTPEAAIPLPAELLVHRNVLTVGLSGSLGAGCGSPAQAADEVIIDPGSSIEMSGARLALANDLGVLPLPFVDGGTTARVTLPVVFLTQPSLKAMQAAGIVASWFGALRGSRAMRFPVSVGTIPASDAVVIAEHGGDLPAALGGSGAAGASVAVRKNPGDATSSLLVISGGNGDELLTAARALAVHTEAWQGQRMVIRDVKLPGSRSPDDAPRWLQTDGGRSRTGLSEDLDGDGSTAELVYLRLPPDLWYGDRQNLAFHVRYRYNGVPLGDGSRLQTFVNGALVSSTALPHSDQASGDLETVVAISVADLRPFSNTLAFRFVFERATQTVCGAGAGLDGAILKGSYLDVSGIPHSVELPNLELFANAGYPFTRYADLGETAVVLPAQPSVEELDVFLGLMGHFGAQTGVPALRVTVDSPAELSADGRKDYLVIGTMEDQPALKQLNDELPVQVAAGKLRIRSASGLMDRIGWGRGGLGLLRSGSLQTEGGVRPDAVVEAIEWPRRSSRSAVVIVLRNAAAGTGFESAFLAAAQSSEIAGGVSLLRGAQFASFRGRGETYRLGSLPLVARILRVFADAPWLIAVITLIFCFLMAALIQAMLRRHARLRLQPEA